MEEFDYSSIHTILAFDPGGTTGVAKYYVDQDEWEREELTGDHHHQIMQMIISENPDIVIYETFNYQRRDITKGVSLRLDSVEYIGVIKLCKQRAAHWGNVDFELVPQTPSLRNWWTDERLRELGLWVSSEHERDATRHLLRYITYVLKYKRFINALKPGE